MTDDIPPSWLKVPLEEITAINMGQSPPSATYNVTGEGLPFFQGKAEFGELYPTVRKFCSDPSKIADAGDVLISVRAPVGPTNLCRERSCIGRGLAAIRPHDGIPSHWLLFYLRSIEPWLATQGTGSTFTQISKSDLEQIDVPLAPLNEQCRIVAKLEKLLGKVDACQQRLAKIPLLLKRFRQSVLAAACSGRLTADWREQNTGIESVNELLARIRRKRPSSEEQKPDVVEPIPNDELPDGWTWLPLWEVLRAQNGRAFPSREYTSAGVRLLRPGNLHVSGKLDWNEDNTALLPSRWAEDYPDFVVERGDLLMNLTAQSLKDEFLGRVCLKTDEITALLNQRICRFKMWTGDDLRPFLFVYFKSPRFRSYVNTLDTGSLIRHMHTKQVLAHVAPIPPIAEQQEIVKRVEALFALADQIEARYVKAKTYVEKLTQSILARAFHGELIPQDPNDEPAQKLLQRIKSLKEAKR